MWIVGKIKGQGEAREIKAKNGKVYTLYSWMATFFTERGYMYGYLRTYRPVNLYQDEKFVAQGDFYMYKKWLYFQADRVWPVCEVAKDNQQEPEEDVPQEFEEVVLDTGENDDAPF